MREGTLRTAIAAALLLLTAACSSTDEPQSAPTTTASSTGSTTTTTAATHTPGALADRWDKTFAAVATPSASPCAARLAQTATCADFLTEQVRAVSTLGAELRQRPDAKSRYLDTQIAIEKVMDESKRYADAKCYEGGGTPQDCQVIAGLIGLGVVNVKMALRGDDLNR
jgi:hypothetical protein